MSTTYSPTAPARGAPQGHLVVNPIQYPPVRRDPTIVDTYYSTTIPDPYRWLEDPESSETRAFVDAQNELTQSVLDKCPTRNLFKDLFSRLYDYEKFGLVFRKGNRYYYSHNSGLQPQPVIYSVARIEDILDQSKATVLIDPNSLSLDGTTALMQHSFSEDGTLIAMAFSDGGSDWRTIDIFRIDPKTGHRSEAIDSGLKNAKFTSLTWTHDQQGIFYNWYQSPETSDVGTETTKNSHQKLKFHRIGGDQSTEDVTVLEFPDQPDWMIGSSISHDGTYLILSIACGCEPTNRLYYVDLNDIPRQNGVLDFKSGKTGDTSVLPVKKLVDNFNASWDYVGTQEDGKWVLQTNHNAPRYKLVVGSIASSEHLGSFSNPEHWTELIPEEEGVLEWVKKLKGDYMVACYQKNVKSVLQLRRFSDGKFIREIALPSIGSVGGFSGSRHYSEFFFNFEGFTEPGAHYRCLADETSPPQLIRRISTKFNPDDFETRQVFVPVGSRITDYDVMEATDSSTMTNTKVPMFIIHRKGRPTNTGDAPTLLYGYGGFNISLLPAFSVARLAWLLAYDGAVAIANCRGGGEFGTTWRDAGSLDRKQNTFDDFIACAEYLQNTENICSPSTLVIQGGSNGGLLVAACINQRPDLFAVGLAQVGVLDGLRFKRFTIGYAWCTDYGDVDASEEQFQWILKWSPLHNVAVPLRGTCQYPAMMLTTADHDDRVVPLHTLKYIAQLQYVLALSRQDGGANLQQNPLLARIEVRAGHGAGRPTQKIIEEVSDIFAFAASVIGAEWKYSP